MLTREGCLARRKRLFARLPDPPDYVLLFAPQHLVYFANYFQTPFVFRGTNAGAVLIVSADGGAVLICDNQLQAFADKAYVDDVVAPVWYRGQQSAPQRAQLLVQTTLDKLKACRFGHCGYEATHVPAGIVDGLRALCPTARFTGVDAIIHQLKRSKDADELAVMRRSLAASDAAFEAARRQTRPGMTELDVFLLVQEAAQRELGEGAIVYGDFVSGARCEKVGGPPSERVIQAGDLVLVDFSVIVRGYRGDCANTFVCGAAPRDELQQLCEACLEAMAAGEALLRAGRACREVDAAVRASFAQRGLAENFHSHSGHGIGLGHPDPPYIVPDSDDTLVAGDVVTLEPGQYIPGKAGMRFEHNFLITETGCQRLSQLQLRLDQGP
jgi:Xaa-Pro aminopeptidase